ncbi:hypothetical protein K443DRAFT_269808 [Laccaria amethystina LaAM-08-1]|uniref:Uncharacterized protein n=1 Tax=Laccaria amethystina LaAM-08-1 TaxID=1095629 RepID=A0A0C9X6L2_9AGAR|nr:hypothetical protein K443DRAFT_269808 [Laccaria amethystina LaAM-08-1]
MWDVSDLTSQDEHLLPACLTDGPLFLSVCYTTITHNSQTSSWPIFCPILSSSSFIVIVFETSLA